MSRRIVRAPIALTIDGAVLLNVVELDVRAVPDQLLGAALQQHGALFVGVALDPHEIQTLSRDVAFVLPNALMPLVGRRLYRR
jgi:hypothetical protein